MTPNKKEETAMDTDTLPEALFDFTGEDRAPFVLADAAAPLRLPVVRLEPGGDILASRYGALADD